jgi:G:T-mismatch repair DNA endonuclease (very short patch repair protein)
MITDVDTKPAYVHTVYTTEKFLISCYMFRHHCDAMDATISNVS